MYPVIGLKNLLIAFALLAVAVFFWRVNSVNPTSWTEHLPLVGQAISISSLVILGVGQSPAFPVICRIPLVRNAVPDISGTWDASLVSNWPVVAEMAGLSPCESRATPGKIRVKARLLNVSVSLNADSGYSYSKAVSVSAAKDEDTGDVRLYYVFGNHTPDPEPTDSSHHFGAAFVDFSGEGRGMTATGLYWTNRNWKKGWNTAGTVSWQRGEEFLNRWWRWLLP